MGTSSTVEPDGATVVVSDHVRLLVTGGDRLEREGLAAALDKEDDLHVLGAVEHDDALIRVASDAPHVAVILYDDAAHLELCMRLTTRRPRIGVVLADSFRSVLDFGSCRDVGAQGFVHRNSPVTMVAEAARAVAAGRGFRDPAIPNEHSHSFGLTDREFQVLSSLEPGCTNRELAAQLYITEDTVKFHLKNIYDKLNVSSREEALVFALREGIVKHRSPRRDT